MVAVLDTFGSYVRDGLLMRSIGYAVGVWYVVCDCSLLLRT